MGGDALLILANGLIVAGTSLMVFSLLLVRRLGRQLPLGGIRRRWGILTAMIVAFIPGYVLYGSVARNSYRGPFDLIVPLVFFLGSVFVLLVSTLSLETALDVRRIYLLEHENITDPLTGAYNRRHLDRRLDEEVLRTRRYGFPLAVLLLDIDHFKRINDEHGHPAGDRVLVALSRVVMDSVRRTDLVARYGGDELMVIAPHATPGDAAELGERLRKKVEVQEFALGNDGPGPMPLRVTISVGVADFREEMADSQGLIQAADEALYAAKQGGRNRVVLRDRGSASG
jgi:diguanylate cyclase (GGDEF)-like protein